MAELQIHTTRQDLWNRAYLQLSSSTKAIIDRSQTNRTDVLSAAYDAAKTQRQQCIAKTAKWKWTKPNGEEVIMRDILEKIMRWIEKFKDVGDLMMQYDPIHAALPWAGIRFLLTVVVSDFEIRGKMICSLEEIAGLITRSHHFEITQRTSSSTVTADIESALVELYVGIFEFLAKTINFFSDSKPGRMLKNIIRSADFASTDKIHGREAELFKLGALRSWQQLSSLEISLGRLADQGSAYERRVEEAEFSSLLNWLSRVDYPRHHAHKAENRLSGTGDWLLGHDMYMTWKQSSSSQLLLLHGIAGCGKSKLATRVIDALKGEAVGSSTYPRLAYFYCDKTIQEALTTSPEEVLKSLVRQLAVTNQPRQVQSYILDLYKQRRAQADLDNFDIAALQRQECIDMLLKIASIDPILIVIDGIDEIPENYRYQLLQPLCKLVDQSVNVVKILLTSRDDGITLNLLPKALRLRIERSLVVNDLIAFVRQAVLVATESKNLLQGKASPEFITILQEFLVQNAAEMFLLVPLQLQKFCRMHNEADIRHALENPSSLSAQSLFEDTYEKISQSGESVSELARRIFLWLILAKEPLSSAAFLEAVTIKAEDSVGVETAMRACQYLVILDKHLDVFRFSHATVQEFIQTRVLNEPVTLLTERCLRSVIAGFTTPIEQWQSPIQCFDHYAVVYWPVHSLDGNCHLDLQLIDFVCEPDGSSGLAFSFWLEDIRSLLNILPYDHAEKLALLAIPSSQNSALFVACAYGITALVDYMLGQPAFDWNLLNEQGHTCLYLASVFGHETVARKLLDTSVNLDQECGRFGSALHAASYCGHQSIVQALLNKGAKFDVGSKFRNVLEAAIWGCQEETALLILNHEVISLDQDSTRSAMEAAASVGLASVLDILNSLHRISVETIAHTRVIQVQITKALAGGQTAIINRLLRQNTDLSSAFPDDGVAIAAAAGQLDAVCFCLDKGLSIEKAGQFGPPLRAASLMNHPAIVVELLRRGADINADWKDRGEYHGKGNALYAASFAGHTECVRILSNAGAELNQKGGMYNHAIHAAAYRGHYEVVRFLIEAGSLFHGGMKTSGPFDDPFDAAVRGGHGTIMRLLVDRGYRVVRNFLEECTSGFRPPGPQSSIHIKGPDTADPHLCVLQCKKCNTWVKALKTSSKIGNDALVGPILGNYRSLGVKETVIKASFVEASKLGHISTVDLFLQMVPDVIHTQYWEALHGAAKSHQWQVFDRILTTPWSVSVEEPRAIDSIFCLASYGHTSLLSALLHQKAVPFELESLLPSLFVTAIENEAIDIASRLMDTFFHSDRISIDRVFRIVCARGDVVATKIFLDHQAKLSDAVLISGMGIAAYANYLDILILIKNNVPERFNACVTPSTLIDAAINGHSEIVRLLLPAIRDNKQAVEWALVEAARNGRAKVCQILIDDGVSINCVVEDGLRYTSPLQSCIRAFTLRSYVSRRSRVSGPQDRAAVGREIYNPWEYFYSIDWRPGESFTRPSFVHNPTAVTAGLIWETICKPPVPCSVSPSVDEIFWTRTPRPEMGRYYEERELLYTLEVLLGNKADPNFLGGRLRLPLDAAAQRDSLEAVFKLIDYGADTETGAGQWARKYATFGSRGRGEILTLLLDVSSTLPMDVFDFPNDIRIGSLVRALGQRPDDRHAVQPYGGFVRDVVATGADDLLELMLNRGLNVTELETDRATPTYLEVAAKNGHISTAKLLLARGAPINLLSRRSSAIYEAVASRNLQMVELLVAHGADMNPTFTSDDFSHGREIFLHRAITNNDKDIVKLLVSAGAKDPVTFQHGNRPQAVSLACQLPDADILAVLLDAGFDPITTKNRYSSHAGLLYWYSNALDMCCAIGNEHGVRLLIERGMNADLSVAHEVASDSKHHPTVVTKLTGGPLRTAAGRGHLPCVLVLLENGANYALESEDGESALELACRNGRVSVARELLTREPKVASKRLKAALESAVIHGRAEIVESILESAESLKDLEQVLLGALSRFRCRSDVKALVAEFIPIDLPVHDSPENPLERGKHILEGYDPQLRIPEADFEVLLKLDATGH